MLRKLSAVNILYLHQYFVPPDGTGGTRSYEFARRLVARGHKVTIITSSAHTGDSDERRTVRNLDGIGLVVLPVRYDNAMSNSERVRAFLSFAGRAAAEAVRHEADVVFATSTPLTIALPGLVARLLTRAPMVFEVRDLWPKVPIAMGALSNPLTRGAARSLEWAAYHGAREVVALSPGMADGVANTGFARNRISVIPNGCDMENFDVDEAEARTFVRRLLPDLEDEQPLISYAGSLGLCHDPGWLVRVAQHMRSIDPGIRFCLVGKGGLAAEIERDAKAAGVLGKNLWMPGPLAKQEVPLLLGRATIATSTMLPMPELEHNSANKFFDGLAAGRPMAINYGGWQAELLREYGAGAELKHDDPRGAAERLAALARDSGRLAKCREGARLLARDHFDRDALAEQLERVLCRAAGRLPESPRARRGVA